VDKKPFATFHIQLRESYFRAWSNPYYLLLKVLLEDVAVSTNRQSEFVALSEIMNTPVITLKVNDMVGDAARKMTTHRIGSVVVLNGSSKPVGILTERDIVARCVAQAKDPWKTQIGDVMSQPLITATDNTDAKKALDLLHLRKIRRLGVTREGKLVGIISERDLLAALPGMYEIMVERAKMENTEPTSSYYDGFCDECNQWSDRLKEIDGRMHCEDCRADAGL
jgi:CBS domain-containing protein